MVAIKCKNAILSFKIDSDLNNYINAIGTSSKKAYVSAIINGLKELGVWNKLNYVYIPSAGQTASDKAMVNAKTATNACSGGDGATIEQNLGINISEMTTQMQIAENVTPRSMYFCALVTKHYNNESGSALTNFWTYGDGNAFSKFAISNKAYGDPALVVGDDWSAASNGSNALTLGVIYDGVPTTTPKVLDVSNNGGTVSTAQNTTTKTISGNSANTPIYLGSKSYASSPVSNMPYGRDWVLGVILIGNTPLTYTEMSSVRTLLNSLNA